MPIIFSGVESKLLTSFAFLFPSCSSACMRARDAAVRPVSLILKNADSAIRSTIAAIWIPISRDMVLCQVELLVHSTI